MVWLYAPEHIGVHVNVESAGVSFMVCWAPKAAPVSTANLINDGDAYPSRMGLHTPCSLRCSLARLTGATTDTAGPPGFQTRGTEDSTDFAFRGGVGTNGARMKVRSLFNVSDKMD